MATEPLPRRLARLSPRRWPVRSRIAAVSAGITFVILIAFALVVGRLVANQLTSEFREETQRSASELASGPWLWSTVEGERRLRPESPDLREIVMSEDGVVNIVDASGEVHASSSPGMRFGPPAPGVRRVGDHEVASQQVLTTRFGGPVFVQYARNRTSLDRTIGRLWLFLAGGVLGGTILAALAGLAVAGRAMRPIASLTATAREVAATRDPSKRIPRPESDDEVAELARILDEMLRQLDAARAETEHMVDVQREFVADASHELRTPLTSILANLELLQAGLQREAPDGDEAEIVDGALRSSRRMRLLVSDLLLLARADAGRAGVRRPCDLGDIAASARDEVRPFASDHELEIETAGTVTVDGNPEELHRLVVNLLENGVRHTPAGTKVGLTLEPRGDEAVLEVTDDGPGLPGEIGDQVFARFVRGGGPADVSADAGTGLGLAIVKAVAESHGGSVGTGQGPAGGARFTVRLPLAGVRSRVPAAAGRTSPS